MTTVEKNLVQNEEVSNLKGKVVVVTGSSKGIGATIAKELAKQGANVVVNYNSSAAGAEKVVEEIEGLGGTAIAVKANVSNVEDAKILIEQTITHFGRVDILVNNAGITRDKTFKKMDEKLGMKLLTPTLTVFTIQLLLLSIQCSNKNLAASSTLVQLLVKQVLLDKRTTLLQKLELSVSQNHLH